MKRINRLLVGQIYFVVFLSILIAGCSKEEEHVSFTDNEFLSALIQLGVDTDGNNQIGFKEAEAVTSLNLTGFSLENLGGIEAFVNLDTLICYETGISTLNVSENTKLEFLYCSLNSLASLDVTNNTKLTFLHCAGNDLTSLDLSKNTLLKRLDVNRNELTALDVSSNPALTELLCADNSIFSLDVSNNGHLLYLDVGQNQLTSLDFSSNMLLEKLWVYNNQLTGLNVSNNTNLVELDIRSMPTLGQVCVWTMPFPPEGVSVYTTDSPNVVFSTECSK